MKRNMFRWLNNLTSPRPLGSVASARRFAAALDPDLFNAADAVCAQLRTYVLDVEYEENVETEPLLALDRNLASLTLRLERDYLTASQQRHSLRERLWDAGYDWAMRFADAYWQILKTYNVISLQDKTKNLLALATTRLCSYRCMAYRYRLYQHEEWTPGIWQEINNSFRKTCDLGIEHSIVKMDWYGPDPTSSRYPVQAYVAMQLLRLCNAGGYTPTQIHTLFHKLEELSFDVKLTTHQTIHGSLAIDLSGTEGFHNKASGNNGQYLFCDTSAVHIRAMSWLDQIALSDSESGASTDSLLALRAAVARLDPDFKPLARASQRNQDHGRISVTYGIEKAASALTFDAAVLATGFEGNAYDYLDMQEIQTFGMLKDSTLRRLRYSIPPEAMRLNLQYWHLRDRSDTGFRCVMPNTANQRIRLHEIVTLTEEAPATGWQVAMVVRLLKLPAGHVELGLQVLSREVDSVQLQMMRMRPGSYHADTHSVVSAGTVFKTIRLKGAFFGGIPLLIPTWILPLSDYQAGALYEVHGTERRYTAKEALLHGTDWVWVKLVEHDVRSN